MPGIPFTLNNTHPKRSNSLHSISAGVFEFARFNLLNSVKCSRHSKALFVISARSVNIPIRVRISVENIVNVFIGIAFYFLSIGSFVLAE